MIESPDLYVEKLELWDTIMLDDWELYLKDIREKENQELTVYNFRLDGTKEYIADWYIVHNNLIKQ